MHILLFRLSARRRKLAAMRPKDAYIKPGKKEDMDADRAFGRVDDPLENKTESNTKAQLILNRSPKSL